jgi:predicted O-methyltransferase YrrM
MPLFGVTRAAMVVTILLAFALFKLGRRGDRRNLVFCAVLVLAGTALNSNFILKTLGVLYQNAYNTTRIVTKPDGDLELFLNNAPSSLYNPATQALYPHIEKTERILIDPILTAKPAKRILVLGAGGFTFGLKDNHNIYIYVDIDPDLKNLAERQFLNQPLGPNKSFVAEGARPYLRRMALEGQKFDLVYIDVFNGSMWIPEPMTTRDFFLQVRGVIKPGGFIAANIISGPLLTDPFSKNINATFESVFPGTLRIPAADFNAWEPNPKARFTNMIYIGRMDDDLNHTTVYTDDRNPVLWDRQY